MGGTREKLDSLISTVSNIHASQGMQGTQYLTYL
jgi:hypothetical protein